MLEYSHSLIDAMKSRIL